jgi:hypothetical protein
MSSLYGRSLALNKPRGGVVGTVFRDTVVIARKAKHSPPWEGGRVVAARLAMTPEKLEDETADNCLV